MDVLAGLLDGPRARGAFLIRSLLDPPWSLHVRDGAPLTLLAPSRGEAWVRPTTGEPVRLRVGDVAVVRGPAPYTVSDGPATPARVVVEAGQRTTDLDGADLCAAMALGTRTWGERPDAACALLTGTYPVRGEVGSRLLRALPDLLVVPALRSPLVALLDAEVARDEPGQEVVLDRLLDLLLVAVLRTWFSRPDGGAPGWLRAHGDTVVGPALRLLHTHPARRWTVASLAAEVGVSRAALARRFTDVVGEPPMAYLTSWRMTLAADLLREPDSTVSAVARRVGYGSEFAFSTAFKRVRGVRPQAHRTGPTPTPSAHRRRPA